MKFSKSWVMEWVRTELSDNALAEQITMAGLEVEEENERAVHVYKKAGYEVLPYMEMIRK